jgi:ABC-type phosphate/phosphonate transport system substrate-binding protein
MKAGHVSAGIMNARMYAVTPTIEKAWRLLLERVTHDAGVPMEYHPYPAPQPLEVLWRREDLGCVFMCGYPIATRLAPVVPLAAPIPRAGWADGRAVYRTDLIVRQQAPFRSLEDTFGGKAGWTVEHSHSGFNAFRHHLLKYRSATRPTLYRTVEGGLVTARNVLDSVRAGRIDIGPLDAYWHLLIARHAPELTRGVRVIASTDTAPTPSFVAAADLDAERVDRLRNAFQQAAHQPWFGPLADTLLLDGFEPANHERYSQMLAWERDAQVAGYPLPA